MHIIVLLVVAIFSLQSRSARADEVFWSTKELLADFFKTSQKVSFVRLDARAHRGVLMAKLGGSVLKDEYVVFVARTGEHIDGYALIDEELGQHQPITFAARLSPDGKVERVEIMVYREGQGGEVREERFRRQFVGKSGTDPLRLGQDVNAIAGATISSRSISVGVRRAIAVVDLVRGDSELIARKR
ncbi:MAG: FMN-binding protein [Deltaproteobacteria bacterium]|nr:FMN-binding protein [Deltaproteobacteria bacterium]